MKTKHIFLILFIGCFNLNFSAQGQSSQWLFGDQQWIRTTANPFGVVTTPANPISVQEGTVCQSDDAGNLLFFYDGFEVREGQDPANVMLGGSHPLLQMNVNNSPGATSSTDCGISIQDPEDCNLYYLFVANTTNSLRPLHYFIIDFNCNPNGEVTYGGQLSTNAITEGITSALHSNGNDVWVIVHERLNDNFLAYLVTTGGPTATPVVSSIGPVLLAAGSTGSLKTNIDGDLLAMSLPWENDLNLFRFSQNNGMVLNPSTPFTPMFGQSDHPYGIEFSAQSDFLYFTDFYNGCSITKYDIPGNSVNQVITIGGQFDDYLVADIQRSENNEILIHGHSGFRNLSNPDQTGPMNISGTLTLNNPVIFGLGLPTFPPYLFGNAFIPAPCIADNFCKVLDDNVLGNSRGNIIESTSDGGYLVGGLGSETQGDNDFWLTKFNSNDSYANDLLGGDFGSSSNETYKDVVEAFGKYYAIGATNNNFGIKQADSEIVLSCFDATTFNLDWTVSYDFYDREEGVKIIETNAGELILAGTVRNNGDDLFFARINPLDGSIINTNGLKYGNNNGSIREVFHDIAKIPGTNQLVAVGQRSNAGFSQFFVVKFSDQLTGFTRIVHGTPNGTREKYTTVEVTGNRIYAAGFSNGTPGGDIDVIISEYDFSLGLIQSYFYGRTSDHERVFDMFSILDEYGESYLYLGGFSAPVSSPGNANSILMKVALSDMSWSWTEESLRPESDVFYSISPIQQGCNANILATGWIDQGDQETFIVKFENDDNLRACCTDFVQYDRIPATLNPLNTNWAFANKRPSMDDLEFIGNRHECVPLCDGEQQYRSTLLFNTNQENVNDLILFPNPTTLSVTLQSESIKEDQVSITLYDLHGRLVLNDVVATNDGNLNELIDISFLAKGTYVLKVQGDNTQFQKKLVIQ